MIAQILLGALAVVSVSAGVIGGGKSVQSRTQDDFGNYAFNYDIVDPLGAGQGRWETGDKFGRKKGAYTITDIDGRSRLVEYVADEHGFRVVVKTNEPGTAASAPAAAIIESPYVTKSVVPAATYAAPVAAYAAPVAAYAAPIVKAPIYRTAPVYAAPVYRSAPLAYASAPIVAKSHVAYASPVVRRPPFHPYGHGHHYGYY